jgi:hypothetical protein
MTWFARTWDWLPRIAALVACGLMAWSVVPRMGGGGSGTAQPSATREPEEPAVVLERVDLQATADTPHLGLLFVFSVGATAPGRINAGVDAAIHDRTGAVLWTEEQHLSMTASGGSGAAWVTLPRTLPADRYQGATAAVRRAAYQPTDP